jgi:cyclohexyl-isocyanide hydratase
MFGAKPVEERVVTDRNRITGGGVTAGIDFGLVIAARLRGRQAAEILQLYNEYDPHPPFTAGTPVLAPSATRAAVDKALAPAHDQARAASARARESRHLG